MQMVMTPDETQIQILAHWPMSHAKRVTRDNRKNPEYNVVVAIRKLRTDKNCPAGKSWPNHVKNEQHIGSEKTYGPKKYWKKRMMQRTANENAACIQAAFSFAVLCIILFLIAMFNNAVHSYDVKHQISHEQEICNPQNKT